MSTSESSNVPPSPPPESPRRGSSTPHSRRPRGSPAPPPMGVPGQSAFTPYTRPPPPPPPPQHWVFPGSSRPSGSGIGGFGFQLDAQAVPVGASGSGGARLAIGGNPAARKRVRDSPSKNPAEAAELNQVSCSLCGKVFMSPKALFGHMRSHPGRGWRGAHPPPAFRPEEEFADIRAAEAAAAAAADAPEEGEVEPREEEEEKEYRVPDLNNPPPAED